MLLERAERHALNARIVGAAFAAAGADVELPDPTVVREQVLAMLHEEPAEVDQERQDWLLAMNLR